MSIADKFEVIADEVYDKGVSDGKKSEYDEFWDVISSNWTRTTWSHAFKYWSCEYIHPPKQIKPTAESIHVFAANPTLKKIEKKYFDFSGMPISSAQDLYQGCPSLETIEDVGLPAMRNYNYIFNGCTALKTIECLRFSNNTTTATRSFQSCQNLEHITIEGEICIDLDFSNSPLSRESIESIINHLSDTTGATLTLKKTAVNREFGINVDDLSTWPEGSDYYKLRWSKANWDFSHI